MSTDFDPYHRWLGIPPKHQSADYYRLLAIERFEADPEVIADAAERQMAHVRRYALGPHQGISQRILNELAAAKVCLLNPDKKAEYDWKLREQVATQEQAGPPPAPASPEPLPPIVVSTQTSSPVARSSRQVSIPAPVSHRAARRPRPVNRPWLPLKLPRGLSPAMIVGGATGGGILVAALLILVWSLFSGTDTRKVAEADVPHAVQAEESPTKGEPTGGNLDPTKVQAEPGKPAVPPGNEVTPKAKPDGVPPKTEAAGTAAQPPKAPAEPVEMPKTPPPKPGPVPAISPFGAAEAAEHQRRWAAYLGVEVEIVNSIGMTLRLIPPGEFVMGSPASEPGRNNDEIQHRVRITKPYHLGVCEVTQAEYERVMETSPSYFSRTGPGKDQVLGQDTSRFPVEKVSWVNAQEFCVKLSALPEEKKAGRQYRLPTEAEWECACRAGTQTRFSFGDDDKDLGEYAWFSGNSGGAAHLVGQKKPNAWGLFDMHGNVWEWCADSYDSKYYQSSPQEDPTGPTGGSYRVCRGGGWRDDASLCRASFRFWWDDPSRRLVYLGFRLARQFPASSQSSSSR